MVIRILSAKYMEVRSVFTPLTRPATCFVFAGNGEDSIPPPICMPSRPFDIVEVAIVGL